VLDVRADALQLHRAPREASRASRRSATARDTRGLRGRRRSSASARCAKRAWPASMGREGPRVEEAG
jgi:hypothetical protein